MKKHLCQFCDITYTYEEEHVNYRNNEEHTPYLICPVCKREDEIEEYEK